MLGKAVLQQFFPEAGIYRQRKAIMGEKNILDADFEEEAGRLLELAEKKREDENRSLRTLLGDFEGRRYILRQLKRAFPLDGGTLCAGREATFYNLGKFESYLEILLDLQQAAGREANMSRQYIAEILIAWFFNEELEKTV